MAISPRSIYPDRLHYSEPIPTIDGTIDLLYQKIRKTAQNPMSVIGFYRIGIIIQNDASIFKMG
jgi:hypothetical protein